MQVNEDILLTIGFAGIFTIALVGGVLRYLLLRRLRLHHHDLWVSLGSPTFMLRTSRELAPFFWKNRYKDVGDPVLSRLTVGLKLIALLGLVVFISIVVSTIVDLVRG